mmetsp:Transcript_104004/g.294357  ORF Transcript_104004/g.294357 Transcript_104004/m.294357 type:complete len:311 (+) Transcript_104004:252-1184(+)
MHCLTPDRSRATADHWRTIPERPHAPGVYIGLREGLQVEVVLCAANCATHDRFAQRFRLGESLRQQAMHLQVAVAPAEPRGVLPPGHRQHGRPRADAAQQAAPASLDVCLGHVLEAILVGPDRGGDLHLPKAPLFGVVQRVLDGVVATRPARIREELPDPGLVQKGPHQPLDTAEGLRTHSSEQGLHCPHPRAPVAGEAGTELLAVAPHGLPQRLHAPQLPRGQRQGRLGLRLRRRLLGAAGRPPRCAAAAAPPHALPAREPAQRAAVAGHGRSGEARVGLECRVGIKSARRRGSRPGAGAGTGRRGRAS